VDGKWGTGTDDRAMRMRFASQLHTYAGRGSFDIRDVQRVVDTTPDGVWGPNTQSHLESWVKAVQQNVLGVPADGVWGPNTDKAFLDLRKAAFNKF
jgi:murein L,D-transpeptidase YcbB/YkuD